MDESKEKNLKMDQNIINEVKECHFCQKKLKLMSFQCKCENTFCLKHMNPIDHNCQFDFKLAHKKILTEKNPLIIPNKI
jgi:predicted nucleic acid binding AN1-type Zn finger protein